MEAQGANPFAPWQSGEGSRRNFRRWSVFVRATLRSGRRRRICIARDFSPAGAAVTIYRSLDIEAGAAVRLVLPGYGAIPAEVRHVDDMRLGLMFTHDDERALALARFLVAQPPPRGEDRDEVGAPAHLTVRGERKACLLSNISRFGAGIEFDDAETLRPEEEVLLRVPGVGSLQAIVMRIGPRDLGLVLIDEYTGGATDSSGAAG